MQFISKCVIFTAVFINAHVYSQVSRHYRAERAGFVSPLDIPLLLSGNYGEIRSGHFHTGIDFKTEQVEGKMVFAADSGYVYRVVVQSGGYGHALYMRHSDGRITVYGHLRQFVPPIDTWVKNQQYQLNSFEADLYPQSNQFTFRKGELIGYSGSTGNSGGPHLHFEIRDKTTSIPFNVLKYKFPIHDGIRPKINWLSICPLDDSSQVNGLHHKLVVPVTGSNENYHLFAENISVSGKIGFGIETFDYLDNSSNPCSPYSVSMYKDNLLYFRFVLDSIPFSLGGCVESHIDYEEKILTGKTIQKLYLDPNNTLPIYKLAINRGIINFSDSLDHNVAISVDDANGNQSQLKFKVHSAPVTGKTAFILDDSDVVARFYYDSLNVFEDSGVRVVVPRNALFSNIRFKYSREFSDSMKYSAIYNVHQVFTPLKTSYVLSIKPGNLPIALQGKVLIAGKGNKGSWISMGGNYTNGYVTAQMKTFGSFFITVDTITPEIIPVNYVKEKKYDEGQAISFHITDKQSGIRKYGGYIDGKWALFEYDGKNDLLTYTIDKARLEHGKLHSLEIVVSDNRDNVSHFQGGFYF